VVDEAELLEGEVEEGAPLPEVAVIHGQCDRNMITDVEEDEGGGRGRDGFVRRSKGIGAGGYRTGGARHGGGQRKVEMWIKKSPIPCKRDELGEKSSHVHYHQRRYIYMSRAIASQSCTTDDPII